MLTFTDGMISGNVMCLNFCHPDAPSTSAASINSAGTDCSAASVITTAYPRDLQNSARLMVSRAGPLLPSHSRDRLARPTN